MVYSPRQRRTISVYYGQSKGASGGGHSTGQRTSAAGMRVINNRYALKREIGRGSSGSVWLAHDESLGRGVALKMLDRALVETLQGFPQSHREAQLGAQLRSPHIVQVYDLCEENGEAFIVMELLEGESLDVRLLRHRRMPLRVACRFVAEVAKGLSEIHAAGIVHRDLKPANIFIAREAGRELVKLLDFGVSSLSSQTFGDAVPTAAEPLVGTPQYMGPEQFEGFCDQRSDLWSLGVIAFQMLTGLCPFAGRNLAELMHQVRYQGFRQVDDLGPELQAFFERALAKNPSERFQSAAELSLTLTQLSEAHSAAVTRVLIVDDEVDTQMLMRQRFRKQLRAGTHELFFALSGEEGLAVLAERDIDIVLTDINMPGMGGLVFIERALRAHPIVRVVVVSAYGDMSNIRTAMNKGAFDFIEKPIDFEDLEKTIDKCAGHVALLRRGLESMEESRLSHLLTGRSMAESALGEVRARHTAQQVERDASVLFIDFYGSSGISEDAPVDLLFAQLNEHLAILVPEVLAQEGEVLRVAGDALFCVYEGERHLQRALATCHSIRERLHRMEPPVPGLGKARDVIFGLDTGRIRSGGIGSLVLGHLEHATLGPPVSMAYRLYGAAKRGELLVSDNARLQLEADYVCEPVDGRVLRGKLGSCPLFRIVRKIEEGAHSEVRRIDGSLSSTVSLTSSMSVASRGGSAHEA
jgi:eukaryotic-like serine/threonine-protein kinase